MKENLICAVRYNMRKNHLQYLKALRMELHIIKSTNREYLTAFFRNSMIEKKQSHHNYNTYIILNDIENQITY